MMNIFNSNQLQIGEQFTSRKYLYLREIERLTGLDIKIVHRELKILLDFNIVDFELIGKTKIFNLKNNIEATSFLIATESNKSFHFILVHKNLAISLSELDRVCDFAIFGSYAKKTDTKESDIDIIIFKKSPKISKIVSSFPVKMHVQYATFESFSALLHENNALAKEILRSHILFGKHKEFSELVLRWNI